MASSSSVPNGSRAEMPANIDAVVFDLDGTLIESEPDLRTAMNRLLEELGRRPVTRDEVVMMIGDGVPKLVERGLQATGGSQADDLDRHAARFMAFYEAAPAELTELFPGAGELLVGLDAAGARIGICTNKPEGPSWDILRQFELDHLIGAVVGGDTLGDVRKPDPRHLGETLRRLDVPATRAVMVGDNANDVATARGLAVPAVIVDFGYARGPVSDLAADAVITRFDELWQVMDELAG